MRNFPEIWLLCWANNDWNFSPLLAISLVDILCVRRRGHRVFYIRVPKIAGVPIKHIKVADVDAEIAHCLASCLLGISIRYVGEVNLFINPWWPSCACDWWLLDVNGIRQSWNSIWFNKWVVEKCHPPLQQSKLNHVIIYLEFQLHTFFEPNSADLLSRNCNVLACGHVSNITRAIHTVKRI